MNECDEPDHGNFDPIPPKPELRAAKPTRDTGSRRDNRSPNFSGSSTIANVRTNAIFSYRLPDGQLTITPFLRRNPAEQDLHLTKHT